MKGNVVSAAEKNDFCRFSNKLVHSYTRVMLLFEIKGNRTRETSLRNQETQAEKGLQMNKKKQGTYNIKREI